MIQLADDNCIRVLTRADLELIQSELHAAIENAQRTLERAEMLLLRLALRRRVKAAIDVADSSRWGACEELAGPQLERRHEDSRIGPS
ncbi:MAG: hypothetical protein ABI054_13910 [Planctomycetota bacterium]